MSGAPSADLYIKEGNNGSWTFVMENGDDSPFDLTGSVMVWRAQKADGTYLTKTTPDTLAMPNPGTGEIGLTITVAESRMFKVGRFSRWELERRIDGTERTLAQGFLVVSESLNDDA